MTGPSSTEQHVLAGVLIDGTGSDPLEDVMITIRGGRFTEIRRGGSPPRNAGVSVLDLSGHVVLPGLMDSHCHLFHMNRNYYDTNTVAFVAKAIANAGEWLRMGVTSIRDIGTRENLDLGLRDSITEGVVQGPRMFASGAGIAMTGGGPVPDAPKRFVIEVSGADEARRAARRQLRAGADFVKLFTTAGVPSGRQEMTFAEIQAATEEAHKARKHVAAHAHATSAILDCVRAGVNTIEHGRYLDDEAATQMAARGTFLVPTLSIARSIAFGAGDRWGTSEKDAAYARRALAAAEDGLRMAHELGVKIAVGTDPPRLDTVAMECGALVAAGLSNMTAIVGATRLGAEIVGRGNDFGTVQPGKRADLAVFAKNPLDDIGALSDTVLVMKDGVVVSGSGAVAASAGTQEAG